MAKKKQKKKSRTIKDSLRAILWGRCAGRCSFRGCPKDLTQHDLTKKTINLAEVAHIIGFSEDGPRGEEDLSDELAKDITNLMLICKDCHTLIDTDKEMYDVPLLREMKIEHETRVARAMDCSPNRQSHVILCGGRIGEHNGPLCMARVSEALHPKWFPGSDLPIAINVPSMDRDDEPEYWTTHYRNMVRVVESKVRGGIDAGEIKHVSIFGLAPQPLLISLGVLLSDLIPAEVYQARREPSTWAWDEDQDQDEFEFVIERPNAQTGGPAALAIGTTDRIDDCRIHQVLPNASIWRITITDPSNDWLERRQQLVKFGKLVQPLLDAIKNSGDVDEIHVFPATSVALAIEFGRRYQPKVMPCLKLYDQAKPNTEFACVLTVGQESGGTA